jgi:hypothetical protein
MTSTITTFASMLGVVLAVLVFPGSGQAQPSAAVGPTWRAARAGAAPVPTVSFLSNGAELLSASREAAVRGTSDIDEEPSLVKHLGVGVLGGAVVGLAAGLMVDSQACGDYMVPFTLFAVPAGALGGTVVSTLVWMGKRYGARY